MLIIIIQITMLAFHVLLMLLHSRGQDLPVPAKVDQLYVMAVRVIYAPVCTGHG